ncbi:MAG: patatin-like phospholipase family protein, partial [Myxococcota bacterium]
GVGKLEALWRELELADVMRFGVRQMTVLHRVLLGGERATGLFDATPLIRLVGQGIDWRRLGRNLREGHLSAITVSATNVPTGRPVIFVDRAPGVARPGRFSQPQVVVRGVRIGPAHVLASAAIPVVFPPIRIGRQLHCDGGLRLNTPIAPALHLGVRRLLVVGVSDPEKEVTQVVPDDRYPGATFLLGKVLNAFLIDHLNSDLAELQRINQRLADGMAVYGPRYLEKINARAVARGEPARGIVPVVSVRPSEDLGEIASAMLAKGRKRFGRALGKPLLRLVDAGEGQDADLASYLLFDGEYARALMDLGRRDAMRQRDEIASLLFDQDESG